MIQAKGNSEKLISSKNLYIFYVFILDIFKDETRGKNKLLKKFTNFTRLQKSLQA